MNREEWLSERKTGIGSSDAAAVVGLCPYRSKLDVWLDKMGRASREFAQSAMRLKMGTMLEPVIASLYTEATGRTVKKAPPLLRNTERPWQLSSLDYLTTDESRIVELKDVEFATDGWGDPGTDEVPDHYLIQVTHQMETTGIGVADVAALFGKHDFRVYTIHHSAGLGSRLTQQEEEFWQLVQSGTPPAPDFRHHCTLDALKLLYGLDEAEEAILGPEYLDLVAEYERLGRVRREADEDRDAVKARLLDAMKHAAVALLPDGTRLTRKEVFRDSYTVKETTYIQFRVKREKVRVQ